MKNTPKFGNSDVQIVNKQPLYDGFFKMVKYEFRHKLFAGGWSPSIFRELFGRGHAIAVLLFDPKRSEFVMIEQFRIVAMAT